MRNHFKIWLDDQHFSREARKNFEESIFCLRAEAYSASLLFLYLAFVHVVRDRILESQAPAGIEPALWEKIQKDVKNDNSWDQQVFDSIKRSSPACIFILTEDTKNQVEYWKNRRNDCAHSKGSLITLGHVESLQAFVVSNINKFVVNGSKDSLINKIKGHFDPAITPLGKSFDHLIKDIDNCIYKENIKDFIGQVWNELKVPISPWDIHDEHILSFSFVARCFAVGTSNVQQACKDFILTTNKKFTFFQSYPEATNYFNDQQTLIRQIWRQNLFTSGNGFKLYSSLLRYNLIPDDQLNESIKKVYESCKTEVPAETDDQILLDKGFYENIKNEFIADNFSSFTKYNRVHKLIVRTILLLPIDSQIAKAIFNGFNLANYPYDLKDSLNAFFTQYPNKKAEFQSHVNGIDIRTPSSITALI